MLMYFEPGYADDHSGAPQTSAKAVCATDTTSCVRPTRRMKHNQGSLAVQVCRFCGHFVDFECSRENALAPLPGCHVQESAALPKVPRISPQLTTGLNLRLQIDPSIGRTAIGRRPSNESPHDGHVMQIRGRGFAPCFSPQALLRDTRNEANATTAAGEGEADGAEEEDGAASDAFFAVDLECVLHKYRRWHECFPRVKPFYGENASLLFSLW